MPLKIKLMSDCSKTKKIITCLETDHFFDTVNSLLFMGYQFSSFS